MIAGVSTLRFIHVLIGIWVLEGYDVYCVLCQGFKYIRLWLVIKWGLETGYAPPIKNNVETGHVVLGIQIPNNITSS